MRHPFVHTQHFKRQAQAGGAADVIARVVHRHHHVFAQPQGHEVPAVVRIHRPQDARRVGIDLPIHDARAVAVRRHHARCFEHDVVVAGQAKVALHLGANGFTHPAAAAVAAHQVIGLHGVFLAGFKVAHGSRYAAGGLGVAHQFVVQVHLYTGQGVQVFAHHLLHRVLRNPL